MATFRVGQRVRIRKYKGWPEAEGTISRLDVDDPEGVGDFCHSVIVDGYPTANPNGFAVPVKILEPIQPSGQQVIAWSECLWQPEHLRESA